MPYSIGRQITKNYWKFEVIKYLMRTNVNHTTKFNLSHFSNSFHNSSIYKRYHSWRCIKSTAWLTGQTSSLTISRSLKKAEKIIQLLKNKCLVIVYTIKLFRPYVYGQKIFFTSDHKPIQCTIRHKDLYSRLTLWPLRMRTEKCGLLVVTLANQEPQLTEEQIAFK